MIYVLKISQYNTDYMSITGASAWDEGEWIDPNLYFEVSDVDKWTYVRNLLESGATITYPASASPTADNINITNYTPLKAAKIKAFSIASQQLYQRLEQNLSLLDYFEFIISHDFLLSKGYTITDENRSEKYLEIINTGDKTLEVVLEKYLDARDRITAHSSNYSKWVSFKNSIKTATTVNEIKSIFDSFMANFR